MLIIHDVLSTWGVFSIILLFPPLILLITILSWNSCKNSAEQVIFYARGQTVILVIELILLLGFSVLYIIYNSSAQSQFLNITQSSSIKEFVLINPSTGISVLIGILTIFGVYLYFFNVFGKTPYFSERSQIQETYSEIFWRAPLFILICAFIIIFLDFEITKNLNFINLALLLIGLINLFFTVPIAYSLKTHFFNSNLSGTSTLKQGDFNYKFLENFGKITYSESDSISSDCILILTLTWAVIAVFQNCNILLFLFTEYCLLVAHYWSSQLEIIPKKKTTIELIDTDCFGNYHRINDVYLLSSSSTDYVVVLKDNDEICRVMKKSIHKMIDQ